MKKPLWVPSEERARQANITQFIKMVNAKHGSDIKSYDELYRWSVEDIESFWESIWDFCKPIASRGYVSVYDDLSKFPGTIWFSGSELNFAENLLKYRDEHVAVICIGEDNKILKTTYSQLYDSVAPVAASLLNIGVYPGDRIAGYMPNVIETVIAMLASTSAGAVWSSVGTELGVKAVVDRLSQIEPKVLVTIDGYSYKGNYFDLLPNVENIVKSIPSLEKVIVVKSNKKQTNIQNIPNSVFYDDFLSQEKKIQFKQLKFNDPVFIMFSSGTTGKPKCMVQSAGGVLINHLKELILHADLGREDKLLYISTPSWMMWNWSVSSLAVGATLVLYDGNPNYPDWKTMWRLIQDEKLTIFGCSASYINYLKSLNAEPGKDFDLSSLREISQTGSALSAEGFEYVYEKIKQDLHFNSIAGGTDINGCFVAGTPIQPVYAGELQGPALGMKVKAYNAEGRPVVDQQGELVCEAPAPSMPLYFWKDENNRKYREAYFSVYSGVWRHGDWIVIHSETGGITFLGRSDFTLKPSGVRIGPAEIYNIVEKVKEITDSMVIGQDWEGDQRIILFVKLAPAFQLTEDLKNRIKKMLREQASPRHVPALIIEVPEIPYTCNMKKVESAINNIMNGRPVTNKDALINPESLDFYEKMFLKMTVATKP
jgi:acetoacetyl-CoA synthetase